MSEESTIEDLQADLAAAVERAQANLAGWQRAQADYSNLKKENERQIKETVAWANASFMAEVLPVYNHYKLALRHIPEEQKKESWVQGIIFIEKQFKDFLQKYNISEIKTVGEKFDPNIHEAISYEAKEGFGADTVFEEIAPGYMLEDKVLAPAKVKVAK